MCSLSSDIWRNCCTSRQKGRQHFRERRTPAGSANNRKQLPLNGGSGCWIYHALDMTSFDLEYTSPLIASASLTWAFNQTLWEQFSGQPLSSIFPQLFGVLILRSTEGPIGFTRLTSSLVSRDEEISSPCQILHTQLSTILLILYKCLCSKGIESNQMVIQIVFRCLNQSLEYQFFDLT